MHRSFVRLRAVLLAGILAATGIFLGSAAPASAANADALILDGGGGIFPGLGAAPTAQAFFIAGGIRVTGTNSGTYTCALAGSGFADSWVEGVGAFAGNCGPIALSCVYVRVAVAMPVACVETGLVSRVAGGLFSFNPQQLPPSTITSFVTSGVAAYADV